MNSNREPSRKRVRWSWYLYDWANSAYITTIAVTLVPAWFVQTIASSPEPGISAMPLAPESMWGIANAAAAFTIFLTAPFLSAIADLSSSRRGFLAFFVILGTLASSALFFMEQGMISQTLILFALSQVGFIGANIFYDSFLPLIAEREELDRISATGYATGYLGGGLNLLMATGMIWFHEAIGLTQDEAIKAAILMAALWWLIFSIPTLAGLKRVQQRGDVKMVQAAKMALPQLMHTIRDLGKNPQLLTFLLAFLLYNEGIQTVIQMSGIYGKQTLGLSTQYLAGTFLAVQAVAVTGAILFGWLARHTGAKRAVMISLLIWTSIILYASFFLDSPGKFLMLSIAIGFVLGGTQALSRSLFASAIPEDATAQYFSFYSVASKFAAITGPLLFVFSREFTGSIQMAMLSTLLFFITGLVLLALCRIRS